MKIKMFIRFIMINVFTIIITISCSNTNSLKDIEKKAMKGDSDASYKIGVVYLEGKLILKNIRKGVDYITKSANQNNIYAKYKLGELYKNGIGLEKNSLKSKILFEEVYSSALEKENFDRNIQCLLGNIYYEGNGVEKNIQKAIEYYKKSADVGNPEASYYLSKVYSSQKKNTEQEQCLVIAAELGYIDAQYDLGVKYVGKVTKGVEKNIGQGLKWLKIASNNGDNRASYFLGDLFFNGKGVTEDKEMGFSYFVLSAKQGNVNGFNMLFMRVANNDKQAFKYFKELIDKKNYLAFYEYGNMCLNGINVDKNEEKAFKYFKQSYEYGNDKALDLIVNYAYNDNAEALKTIEELAKKHKELKRILGNIYINLNQKDKGFSIFDELIREGDINSLVKVKQLVLSSDKDALQLFSSYSDTGNISCSYDLGEIYFYGKGVEKDENKALNYFIKISSYNQYYSFKMIDKLIQKDNLEAFNFVSKLSEQGNIFAKYEMAKIYLFGYCGVEKNTETNKLLLEEIVNSITEEMKKESDIQCLLSDMCFNGYGVTEDIKEGLNYLTKSAEDNNDMISQYELGKMFFYNNYVVKDDDKVTYWYLKSKDQGFLKAIDDYESIDLHKKYLRTGEIKYKEKLKTLSANYNDMATFLLGYGSYYKDYYSENYIYANLIEYIQRQRENGIYIYTKNIDNKIKVLVNYLQESLKCENSSMAQYFLGTYYLNNGNEHKAERYLSLAAKQGNHLALCFLGYLYLHTNNHNLGLKYINKAAKIGNSSAKELNRRYNTTNKSSYNQNPYKKSWS